MQFLNDYKGDKSKKRQKKVKNKKAQVTIFVIIAVVVIAAIAFFLIRKPTLIIPTVTEPSSYIEKCAKDAASSALDVLSSQGGSINPEGWMLYENKKISYLCFTSEYYKGCVNQQPVLKQHVENETTTYIKPKIQKCAQDLISQLEAKGYAVSSGALRVETILQPQKVLVNVYFPLTITKEQTEKFDKFQGVLLHPIYDQVALSQEIVNSEASAGDFDQLTYMLAHRDVSISKYRVETATIYKLLDKKTNKQFVFAVKSYVTPPGLW